jgi:hypothetical protein
MGYRRGATIAMFLRDCGWKVRQIGGRRIWYKGKAGAEIVARGMEDAERMEYTLRKTRAPSLFMYGPDVAELLGAMPPPAPPTKLKGMRRHVALAEELIRELDQHEGAAVWSKSLKEKLAKFKFITLGGQGNAQDNDTG